MVNGDDAAATPETAVERELRIRRTELERTFDDKLRDLKAQERRRMERIKQEQAEWEETKRRQTKEFADRAEKLRRNEAAALQEASRRAETKQELTTLRQSTEATAKERETAATQQATLEAALAAAQSEAKRTRRVLSGFAAVALLGGLAWLATTRDAPQPAALLPVVFLVFVALLLLAFVRLRGKTPR